MSQIAPTNSKLDEYNRTLFLFESARKAELKITEFFNNLLEINQIEVKGVIAGSDSSFITQLQSNIKKTKLFSQVKFVLMNQINVYLGSTLDFIVIDLRTIFRPNNIISLVETVRGGGIIVIIGSEKKSWVESVNKEYLPNSKSSKLLDWFLTNISKNSGCLKNTEETQELISFFKPMPFGYNLTKNTIGIPVSSNQNEVIEDLISDLKRKKSVFITNIIIADRGRGKSAAVGLFIAKSIVENQLFKSKIIITARDISHTRTIFGFISRGLTKNSISHRLKKEKEQIIGIEVFKRCYIEFRGISDLTKDLKCQLLVVDEAAAFPQEKLLEIVGMKAKKVFISTIHGYEGAGRSFQYKILNHIQRRHKDKYRILRLTEP
ncbi:MAG: tRNA(Met) cytidine acetyltransferase, partial [Candidatus Heimdallarchaeota archaeon]|nr:tRNA(Met) cytidine acetyltransferase [Candidatus Heimdallarchaeota archaeon]